MLLTRPSQRQSLVSVVQRSRHYAAMVALLLIAGAAQADPIACTLASNESSKIQRGDQPIVLPAHLPDCAGATVTQGSVVACISTRLDTLKCAKLTRGQTVSRAVFGPKDMPMGWRASLTSLLQGGVERADAKSRGALDELPSGQVLMSATSFDIDFTQEEFVGVQAIEFREGDRQGELVVRVPAHGLRSVDATRFQPGKTYSWAILPAGDLVPFYGQFTVLDKAERRHAKKLARRLAEESEDRQIQAMLIADSLYQRGHVFDARQTLKQAVQAR